MTRRLVLTVHSALDGVVEPVGDLMALDDHDGDELAGLLAEDRAQEVALLLGRRTFETLRADWSGVGWDPSGTARHLAAVDRYVVTTSAGPLAWATEVLLGGGRLADDVAAVLKDGPDGDVGVLGSITLAHALLRAGLVDELRLLVHPLVVGHGRRLFPPGCTVRGLLLVESRVLRSGITRQVYRWR